MVASRCSGTTDATRETQTSMPSRTSNIPFASEQLSGRDRTGRSARRGIWSLTDTPGTVRSIREVAEAAEITRASRIAAEGPAGDGRSHQDLPGRLCRLAFRFRSRMALICSLSSRPSRTRRGDAAGDSRAGEFGQPGVKRGERVSRISCVQKKGESMRGRLDRFGRTRVRKCV